MPIGDSTAGRGGQWAKVGSGVAAALLVVVAVLVPGQAGAFASTATATPNGTTTSSPTTTTSSSTTTTSSTTQPAPPPPQPTVSASPNSQLQNLQVVTVSWQGFHPTAATKGIQGYDDMVGIFECTANPSGGHYFYYRDCMVNTSPGSASLTPGDGNAIGSFNDPLYGVTGPDGTGAHAFQVQSGTLHNDHLNVNIQCDTSNPCVLKVIDYPQSGSSIPFKESDSAPDTQPETKPPFDYSDLLDSAPSVPLNFGQPPVCPPITAGNLTIEGASSSSYALQVWAAALCQGANPVTVSYSEVGEAAAKKDFLGGSSSIAVASQLPTSSELSALPGPPSVSKFGLAPLTAGGVSIAFVMQDAITGLPITSLRLTPRLAAMLITNSGTLDNTYTASHDAAYAPLGTTFKHPLTADPEFVALNPGFTPPAVTTGSGRHITYEFQVEEPIFRAEQNDDTSILTQWIASDYDAQQFLLGLDPCGAQLDRWWQGVSYPTDQFSDLEQGSPSSVFPKEYADFYFPVQGTAAVVKHLLYQNPVGFQPGLPPAPATAINPPSTRNSAYFAVMDTVTARRSAFSQATLIAANPNASELSSFVNESSPSPGSCTTIPGFDPTKYPFVASSDAALGAAYRDMAAHPAANGILVPPVASTDQSAYPLAKIDYAYVPLTGIGLSTANLIASLLRYTAGHGRMSSNLAYGYPPLPDALAAQALAVARSVVQAATPAATASTPGTTTPPTGGTAGSSVSLEAQPSTGSGSRLPIAPGPISGPAPQVVRPKVTQLAAEGPVSVDAAAVLAGKWLLPLVLVLALLSGLAGGFLRRRVAKTARTAGRAS